MIYLKLGGIITSQMWIKSDGLRLPFTSSRGISKTQPLAKFRLVGSFFWPKVPA
jgi:hypothetical protein